LKLLNITETTSADWHKLAHRRQSWGLGVSRPPRFWAGVMGSQGDHGVTGDHGGRETLLYLIMYRKYVRKWWLFKRSRI